MGKKKRIAGRFLPSRVYARWKWTVNFGLWAVPLILFLSGSLILYFTPSRYQSTVVFEYLGKREPAKAAALLKSKNVIDLAATELKLTNLVGLDSDTLAEWISEDMQIKVDEATGMIELKVTNSQKEVARNLAAQLPLSLEAYERAAAVKETDARLESYSIWTRDAEDQAEETRKEFARLVRARGGEDLNPISRMDVDDARSALENARGRIWEMKNRHDELARESEIPKKWVVIHSPPVISQTALKSDDSLGNVILQSLGTGLAFALLIPYLLELAFPRRIRSKASAGEEWSEAAEPEMTGLPV
ncbi:MAG: hypothetical protein V4584_17600 [Verrucomicrobiota bacterium]